MIFTKEQVEIGDFDLSSIDFGELSEDQLLEIFNNLPNHIQGNAVNWGFSDTVFRDNFFVYILNNQFNVTPQEYYAKKMHKNSYVFDFGKLKRKD